MISINNLTEVDRIIRECLIEQTDIKADLIRNSLSQYGTMMNVNSKYSIFESVTPDDLIILFEPSLRSSNSNVSFAEDDESISSYVAMNYHLFIYGNSSASAAAELKSRLESESSRYSLYDQGVYLENVSECMSVNEYDNGVLWMRTDLDINISVQLNISPKTPSHDYSMPDINIIIKE